MPITVYVKGMKEFGKYSGTPKQVADKVSTRTSRKKVVLYNPRNNTYYKYALRPKKYRKPVVVEFDGAQVKFKKSGGSKFKGVTDPEGAIKYLK